MPLDPDLNEFTTTPPVSLNVDFTDIATGRGFIEFDLARVADDFILTTNAIYSDWGAWNARTEYSDATSQTVDDDFDITFNRPIILEGPVTITLPVWLFNNSGSSQDVGATATLTLRKFDGSTETDLGSDSVTSFRNIGPATTLTQIFSVKFNISRTTLAKGNTLRITLASTSSGGATKVVRYYHDPVNRTSLATNLDLARTFAFIPVVIE